MRRGDSDREIARSKAMGHWKAAKVRAVAADLGWMSPDSPLPDDAALLAQLDRREAVSARCVSTLDPWRGQIAQWHVQGIQGTAIHNVLVRNHGYMASYPIAG